MSKTQVAQELLLKAAGGMADALGCHVVAEFFPDNTVPAYFSGVYKSMRGIIKDALTQQTINETMGEIQGTLRYLNNEYLAEKSAHGVTDDLLQRLQRRSDQMYEHIGKVMEANTACTGISTFMVGATIHLAILQEIALEHKKRGSDTGNIAAKSNFRDYADHLSQTFETIRLTREKAVTVKAFMKAHTSIGHGVWYDANYHWHDSMGPSGHRNGGPFEYQYGDPSSEKNARRHAEKSRNQQRAALIANLRTQLGQPEKVATQWRATGDAIVV